MNDYTAKESCSCGATVEVSAWSSYTIKDRLDEFRVAHSECRRTRGSTRRNQRGGRA